MYHKPKVPDRQILQKVTTQLPRRGIRPPCNVRVSVHDGTVTLSGTIQFDLQRKAAVHAATAVNGVQRVVDQMTVMHSTIGGWHSVSPGTRVKYVPAPSRTPPQTEPAETPPAAPEAANGETAPSPPEKSDS